MRLPKRFDARAFETVTEPMKRAFERDGVLVLDGMISDADCDALKAHTLELVSNLDATEHHTTFSTTDPSHQNDSYFLSSGHKTRFFFEDGAFNEAGELAVPMERALNKLGHAMHDLDPVFDRFSRQPRLERLAKGLGSKIPLLLQSMYIFKPPLIGGEVTCHQDATFLWTEPQSVIGFWFALEDATIHNGCLWGLPGEDKGSAPKKRFRRISETETAFETYDESPFPEAKRIPLEASKGTLIAFNGLFPHLSSANRSNTSRHAYTLHIIDGAAYYPDDNWLQRPAEMPLRGFS